MRGFFRSFGYALEGVWTAIKGERQLRIHTAAAVLAVLCGIWFDLTNAEWAILWLAIAGVLAAELMNTAVERVVDLVTPKYHPLAKQAKDIAAASVLVAAGGALFVGICLFGSRILG